MRRLLIDIRRTRTEDKARFLRLPLHLVRSILMAAEPVALRFLPLTAGQLASFVNDAKIVPSQFVSERHPRMKSIQSMLGEK